MQQEKPLYPLQELHWNMPFTNYFVGNYNDYSYYIVNDSQYNYCIAAYRKGAVYWRPVKPINPNYNFNYIDHNYTDHNYWVGQDIFPKIIENRFYAIEKEWEKYMVLI